MFPVSLNPYFNPTLSFSQSPFINPEWAMRAYAQHAWDPFSAQAYYRGYYPHALSGIDPTGMQAGINPTNINPLGLQSQISSGFGSPSVQQNPSFSQGQLPIGFVSPSVSQSQVPIGF